MKQLTSIFENHFTSSKISDVKMKSFAQDHIQKLLVANGAGSIFTSILAATNAAYTGYYGSLASTDLASVVQKSLTLTTDTVFDNFIAAVRQEEGLVRSVFAINSPQYIEFFPRGLTEYNKANKKDVEIFMNRFATLATTFKPQLGVAFETKFATLLASYNSARASQLNKIGDVGIKREGKAVNRDILETQLCANIGFIMFTYPTNIDKCLSFFDESILAYQQNKSNDGLGKIIGTITHNGNPLSGATIEILNTDLPVANTKADGIFRTNNIATGIYLVQITRDGFEPQKIEVDIIDEGSTLLNVALIKIERLPEE
jgi:Carboxypeptidase regulatory-like domain